MGDSTPRLVRAGEEPLLHHPGHSICVQTLLDLSSRRSVTSEGKGGELPMVVPWESHTE